MSEWNHRNPFIPRQEGWTSLPWRARLKAIGAFLTRQVYKDPRPSQSNHWRPPQAPELPPEALGEQPELSMEQRREMALKAQEVKDRDLYPHGRPDWEHPQLPKVNPVTGEMREL